MKWITRKDVKVDRVACPWLIKRFVDPQAEFLFVEERDLIEQAKKLGVPISSGTYKPKTEAWDELAITDYELHRRIREEQRHRREHRLWIVAVAVVSAVFAFLSAVITFLSMVAAWLAVPNTPQ